MQTPSQIVIYTPSAPSHGRARGYVQNRNVWVLLVAAGAAVRCIRSPGILESRSVATEVDSRYTGERSAYGQAIRRADALATAWAWRLAQDDAEGPVQASDLVDYLR